MQLKCIEYHLELGKPQNIKKKSELLRRDLLRKDLLRMDLLRKDLLRKDLFRKISRGLLHLLHAFVAVTKVHYKHFAQKRMLIF
jgi:hypothetical protein